MKKLQILSQEGRFNILGNFDDLKDNTICTPRNTNQIENIKTLTTNSDLINDNESQDSYIILVHSSDTSYTPSDTPILLNKSIPDNNNYGTIERDNEQASSIQTRSRLRDNILNSGVRTRSMVAESPRGLFTPASMRNTVLNITDSVRRGLNRLDTFYNPSISQEAENTAMIAKCLYYGPTRKTFDWLTNFQDKESFGFGLVTAVQLSLIHI